VILKPKLETFPNIAKERQRKISAKVVGTTIPQRDALSAVLFDFRQDHL
jgi:hypothetical protein